MTTLVYLIMMCGDPIAIIAERPVDGRYVSRAYVHGVKSSEEKFTWIHDGVIEAEKDGEVFTLEYGGECR